MEKYVSFCHKSVSMPVPRNWSPDVLQKSLFCGFGVPKKMPLLMPMFKKTYSLKAAALEILTHCMENCWSLGPCMNIWIDVL